MAELCFVAGPESYRTRIAIAEKTENCDTRYVEEIRPDDIAWLNTVSVFDDKRVLILRKEILRNDKKLLELIKSDAAGGLIIIAAESFDEKAELVRYLRKNAVSVDASHLSPKEFSAFLMKGIKKLGIRITSENFEYLLRRADYPESSNLDKVIIYLKQLASINRGECGREEIDFICRESIETKAFDISSCLERRDFEGAVKAVSMLNGDELPVASFLANSIWIAIKALTFGTWQLGIKPQRANHLKRFANLGEERLIEAYGILNATVLELKTRPSAIRADSVFVAGIGRLASAIKSGSEI